MGRTITLMIGGDFSPYDKLVGLTQKADGKTVFNDLYDNFIDSDFSVINLECPLVDRLSPVSKSGPTLQAPRDCSNIFSQIDLTAVNLANNHIMDHGAEGLDSTLNILNEKGVSFFGAGENKEEALKPLILEKDGFRIAFLGMGEHENGGSDRETSGIALMNMIDYIHFIRKYRDFYDYLVVFLHAGNEHQEIPRPSLVEACRFIVEEGANAVFCQHSHCIGCYENYNGGHILYGQGNMLFDMPGKSEEWYKGLLAKLVINPDSTSELELIPFIQSMKNVGMKRMKSEQEKVMLKSIAKRSEILQNWDLLEEEWNSYCKRMRKWYLRRFATNHKLFRGFDKITSYTKLIYRNQKVREEHLNLIRCESHREVLLNMLSEK